MPNLFNFSPEEASDTDVYGHFAAILSAENGGESLPRGFESRNVVGQITGLVRHGDHLALIEHDGDYDEVECYKLALKINLEAGLQLELACAFLNRADPRESPLCEHQYIEQNFGNWKPMVEIHEIGTGPPARDRDALVKLALAAYGNAWSFYRMLGREFARSLFCLDGMRVCYEELDSADDLWTLCQGVREWIASYNFEYGWLDGDYDAIVGEILSRFSKTEGRLEAFFEGRPKAEKKLQHELGVTWDHLHVSARKHLITAEYKQATLKDPDHPLWDYIDKYRLAIEAMLSNRIGVRLDAYIHGSDSELATRFTKHHLRRGVWKASGLNLGQWSRVLSDPRSGELFSAAGLDHKYVFSELPQDLEQLAPLLDPAHHNTDEEITAEEVETARRETLKVLKGLASVR